MLNTDETNTTAPPLFDQLTGLYNRAGFSQAGHGIVTRACWENTPVTLFYIDVDDFDGFNRKFGSNAGDELLLKVGDCLRKKCRGSDLSARLDADQFVLLMPQTSPESALAVLHRLRGALDFALQHSRWSGTAAIGAVTYLVCPSSVKIMLETVATIVRDLKSAGGGQTVHHVIAAKKE